MEAATITPRARRFEKRLAGLPLPDFAGLMQQRRAAQSAGDAGEALAVTLALLQSKPALDREVDGARLKELAATLGDDLLDAVLEADGEALPRDLMLDFIPPVPTLLPQGEHLLSQMATDPQIARLVRCAMEIVRNAQPDPGGKE